jgi:mono/diheme cytochrome c family protein
MHSQICLPARALVWVLPIMLTVGCNYDFPGKPNPADRPVPDDQVLDFDVLYRRSCAGCHGADGLLGPAPPLNNPTFLAIVPDAELLRVIRGGRHGTPMPGFAQTVGGSLTAAQVGVLAEGIKSRWKPAADPEAIPPYLATKANDTAAANDEHSRGAKLFARACAECHGELTATGEKPDGSAGAVDVPDFLALISNQALRRIIITGRPDLGMPAYSEKNGRPDDFQPLSSAEIDDLVALLADRRGQNPTKTPADNP